MKTKFNKFPDELIYQFVQELTTEISQPESMKSITLEVK